MVTLRAVIERHRLAATGSRAPHRLGAHAAGEAVELVFFGARSDYLTTRFPVGATVLIHGQLDRFGEQWQIAHPELLDPRQPEEGMLPVYRLVQGLGQRRLRALLRTAIVAGAGPARVAAGRSPGGAGVAELERGDRSRASAG